MPTELQQQPTTAVAEVSPDVAENLHIIATSREEMQEAQPQLVRWFEQKIAIIEVDAKELEESLAIAKQNGWSTAKTLTKHANLARKRVQFYEKCKAATAAGYCIVPNFDVDVFAIRTNRMPRPARSTNIRRAQQPQGSEGPSAGSGLLVSPQPDAYYDGTQARTNSRGEVMHDDKGNQLRDTIFRATDWDDEIDFPISVARPQIMSETQWAMAMQVFDEFGVQAGAQRRTNRNVAAKGDPIVVARIIDPRSTTYNRRFVTFLLAWYVNTADL